MVISDSPFSLLHLSRSMTQSSVEPDRSSTGLDNSTYNFISTLAHKANSLYSIVEICIVDARKEKRSQGEDVWQTMKDDKRKYIRIYGQDLSKEETENRM